MRPWAEWTARTALVAVGFAAVGVGLSGVALASPGASSTSVSSSVLSGNNVIASVSIPADVCGSASALLGIASAGCRGLLTAVTTLPAAVGSAVAGTPVAGTALSGVTGGNGNVSAGGGNGVTAGASILAGVCGSAAAVLGGSTAGCAGGAATGNTDNRPAGTVIRPAVVPVTGALGSVGALAGLPPVSGLTGRASSTGRLARSHGPSRGGRSGRRGRVGQHLYLSAPHRFRPGWHECSDSASTGRTQDPAGSRRPALAGRAGEPACP